MQTHTKVQKFSLQNTNVNFFQTVQLVSDHSELEREKPKLEKKVQILEERKHELEQKLRESEKERHRYQNEANRIKEMMQRNVMSTRHAAQIGKLITIESIHRMSASYVDCSCTMEN